ncbi:MAG: putative endopeptidase [Candidatus Azotimanducaceae bacterium]|jgi:putative endopeptidase
MNRFIVLISLVGVLSGCNQSDENSDQSPPTAKVKAVDAKISGIDLKGMDLSVRPQDDYYEYANGTWLKEAEIPGEEIGWGSYMTLRKKALEQSRAIVEAFVAPDSDNLVAGKKGAEQKKIGDYYAAWLNEALIAEKGVDPLLAEWNAISALSSHDDVARFFGDVNAMGVDGPFNFYVGQDDKDSTQYVVFFLQSGLGLPDRDYYFDDSERGKFLLEEYSTYVTQLFTLADVEDAAAASKRVVELEAAIAQGQWSKVDNRDADKIYNPYTDTEFRKLLGNFKAEPFLAGIGVEPQPFYVVMQPSYFKHFNDVFTRTSVATWQDYLRLRLLSSYANFLPEPFVAARFNFYSKTISGLEEMPPRWRRAINSINQNIGELLGKFYVERHFAPESKARMQDMVRHLSAAYADSIRSLEWMSSETKEKALIKLSKFTPKIGYPDKWRDYSTLTIASDDLVGNIKRSRIFSHQQNVSKLGKPIDRDEWFMAPQVVNAYYNPGLNEIVFPAAYLQPPNFLPEAEDAYNYGTIGVTIGHEIGHGFDDQGSKYDGDGNLRRWWTDSDRANFESLTAGLVAQFNLFEALPGLFVNGELTLGENIGDLGGTAIALKAYRLSLDGAEPPVLDGFTAEERFFLGNAQTSRLKWRDQFLEYLVKNDPHSPDRFRINGVLPNMEDFYQTYGVKKGDKLYLPTEERISIW